MRCADRSLVYIYVACTRPLSSGRIVFERDQPLLDDRMVLDGMDVEETSRNAIGSDSYGGSVRRYQRSSTSSSRSPRRKYDRIRRDTEAVSETYTDACVTERVVSCSEYESHVGLLLSAVRRFVWRRWSLTICGSVTPSRYHELK